jgi:tetratricopeptide (TPR) repeat protein
MRGLYTFLMAMLLFCVNTSVEASTLDNALNSYVNGEKATSFVERSESFNEALRQYLDIKKESTAPSAKLYYNIGNCYFQLSEYGWAIYYYYKALALDPYDEKIKENLEIAIEKAEVVISIVREYLSSLEYEYALAILIAAFFLAASFLIWIAGKIWRLLTYALGFAAIAGLVCYFYFSFFAPLDAILIKPSMLYKDAGAHYVPVKKKPVFSGERVQVIEQEGDWVKIVSADGTVGYALSESLRIL